jgi:protein-disulfide isomerase
LIEADVAGGVRNGVEGTPSLFINGQPYQASYEPATLMKALRSAN